MQINITAGKATIDKIDALKKTHGSRSQVVAIAVDRYYQSEWARSNGELLWMKPEVEPDNA